MIKFIRFTLGRIILLADFITRPRPIIRKQCDQEKVDEITSMMSLYQFNACPFCVKVRRHLRRNSLNIEFKDAKNDTAIKKELVIGGGKHKVPCLRIEIDSNNTRWLYSSDDICLFLDSELRRLNIS
jgi:glutaredoxin